MKFWLWPNRVIGKRRSGELREEHNKAVQQIHDLRNALEAIDKHPTNGNSEPDSMAEALDQIHAHARAALEATKEES